MGQVRRSTGEDVPDDALRDVMASDRRRQLIERLVGDATPIRRLPPPGIRVCYWLTLGSAMLAAFAFLRGRSDLALALCDRTFLATLAFRLAAATALAWLALRAAIPGREPSPVEVGCGVLVAALGLLAGVRGPADQDQTLKQFIAHGWPCLTLTGSLAALPWVALVGAIARGMPCAPSSAGALAAGASYVLAAVGLSLACPIEDSLHLLVWHVGSGTSGMAIASLLGAVWLGHRARSGRRAAPFR